MGQLITIWWRDIPLQVIAKQGRTTEKRILDKRFQFAVDKAAMNAGKKSYGDYIEEMQRSERACGDDLTAEADGELARLDAAYTKERLHALIASGGEGDRL
ncbi:MAG TPA: virulence factor [Candidatus Limnocylindrales bacterium]|nr:virulence factor [Candidatus Limnocylindrales bacterium]